jgi:hypothetical protein
VVGHGVLFPDDHHLTVELQLAQPLRAAQTGQSSPDDHDARVAHPAALSSRMARMGQARDAERTSGFCVTSGRSR